LKDTHEYAKMKKVTFTRLLVTQGCRTVLECLFNEVDNNERQRFEKMNETYGIFEALEISILYDQQRQLWNQQTPTVQGYLKEIKSRRHDSHINPANMIGKLWNRTLRSHS
jgi:hypothetical protein